jgi:hypothetical protein
MTKEQSREYYKKYRIEHKEQIKQYRHKFYQSHPTQTNMMHKLWYEWLTKLGHNKCYICGYDKDIRVLDMHHIDPNNKNFSISSKFTRKPKLEYLQEINKCIALCPNCHREIHYGITKL